MPYLETALERVPGATFRELEGVVVEDAEGLDHERLAKGERVGVVVGDQYL